MRAAFHSSFIIPHSSFVISESSRVAPVVREEFGHEAAEAVEVYGLREVAVETRVEGGLAETVRVEGRERDDGHALQLGLLAYAPRGGEAVLLRHGDVHQDEVGARELRDVEGVRAVRGRDDAVAHVLKREAYQDDVVAHVVDDQNRMARRLHDLRSVVRSVRHGWHYPPTRAKDPSRNRRPGRLGLRGGRREARDENFVRTKVETRLRSPLHSRVSSFVNGALAT